MEERLKKRWFHVVVDYACWGFAANDEGVIIDAPPIAMWMKGKKLEEVRQWFLDHKAFVREVK